MRYHIWAVLAFAGLSTGAYASETVLYKYDELGRLIQTQQNGTINNGVVTDLDYDPAGNRTDYEVTGSNGAGDPTGTGATGGGTTGGGGGGGGSTSTFAISDASGVEGGSLTFTVVKSGSSSGNQTVSYATADSSAFAGSDYVAVNSSVVFAPSETSKTITINTMNDSAPEPTEIFHVDIFGPANTDQGAGTISDDNDTSNMPPETTDDTATVGKCSQTNILLTDDDYDNDGNHPITLVGVSNESAEIISDTSVSYNAPPAEGVFYVTYTIKDSLNATATGLLTVTVSGGSCGGF